MLNGSRIIIGCCCGRSSISKPRRLPLISACIRSSNKTLYKAMGSSSMLSWGSCDADCTCNNERIQFFGTLMRFSITSFVWLSTSLSPFAFWLSLFVFVVSLSILGLFRRCKLTASCPISRLVGV